MLKFDNQSKNELNDYLEQYYFPLKSLDKRVYVEPSADQIRNRNNYQRDYSRILYSSSFRRLQGKMQLLGVESDAFYRNRLTHSLEVAQISKSIAELIANTAENNDIYKEDMYVVEAGSLAHDIGNPPFGHHGEKVINNLMENDEDGGFEGNAQSLRVLHKLEKKLPHVRGLNLTLRSLYSIVKYYVPFENLEKSNKFIYNSDFQMISNKVRELGIENIVPRTLDVQIIDLADEIAYAAHDLEDALSLKMFNIDEFLYEIKNELKCDYSNEVFDQLVKNAKTTASKANNFNSSEEYSFLFRKELTSNLVHRLVLDIALTEVRKENKQKTGTLHDKELGFYNLEPLVKAIKGKTFASINRSATIQLYEKKGEKIIKGLFEVFRDTTFNKENMLLPVEYRGAENQDRIIADYISGMMDSYATTLFEDFFGKNNLNTLYEKNYFGDYHK